MLNDPRFDATTLRLLSSLTTTPRIVRETRGDRATGAPHYAIGALVRAGLAERETQQSVSQRGVAVQKTLLRLRAAEVA